MTPKRTDGAPWMDFVHTGPGTLAGAYLRRFWQPIYRTQDLAPGRSAPVELLGERFTLYRGESGEPHLLAFRCAHRGTQLSTGWVEGDDLRCFYHGWKYDSGGQCVEQPAEPEPFSQKVRIPTYPVQEYLGLIFAYLGEGDSPPIRRFPEFEDEDHPHDVRVSPVWPCNFFNRLERVHDEYRIGFASGGFADVTDRAPVDAQETDLGIAQRRSHPSGEPTSGYVYLPNVHQYTIAPRRRETAEAGGWDTLHWIVPVDDTRCRSFSRSRSHVQPGATADYNRRRQEREGRIRVRTPAEEVSDAILAGRLRTEDVLDRTMNLNVVWDYVTVVGQGPMPDRGAEHLGASDAAVVLLRQVWQRELRALAEGRPLTEWRGSGPLGC